MAVLSINEATELERIADQNDGHCPTCHQTINIYRYRVNKAVGVFIRAMADAARNTGVNDVDVSTIGLAYSVRTQSSKLRQHGLIARVKNERGAQIPRRWLITRKGYDFLGGNPIPAKVVIYNNQVLGHDGGQVTIHQVMGEKVNLEAPLYEETPVSPAEARTYNDVRHEPKRQMRIQAMYKGRGGRYHNVQPGEVYELAVERLAMGNPVKVTEPVKVDYRDIAAFQKEWKAV